MRENVTPLMVKEKEVIMSRATSLLTQLEDLGLQEAPIPVTKNPSTPAPSTNDVQTAPAKAADAPNTNIQGKEVPGGKIYAVDITPQDFKKQTARMQQITIIRNKKWNSIFSLHQTI